MPKALAWRVLLLAPVLATLGCRSPSELVSSWSRGTPLPEPLQEIHAAVLAGDVYVAGGFDRSSEATSAAYRFDGSSLGWEAIAPLPEPRHHMPLAVANDTLYAVAGLGPGGFRAVQTLWHYDRGGRTAGARGHRSRSRAEPARSGVVAGRIIVVGGFDDTSRLLDSIAVYDPATDMWERAAPIPTPRDHLGAAVVDGVLYAIGGRPLDSDRNVDAVEAYDGLTDTWSALSPMPTRRGGLAVVAFGDRVYTYGGETRSTVFDTHEVFDPTSDTWKCPGAVAHRTPRAGRGRPERSSLGDRRRTHVRFRPDVSGRSVHPVASDTSNQSRLPLVLL